MVAVSEIVDRQKANNAVARSDYRYRRLFPALAATYWELDTRRMNDHLATVRTQGVGDLAAYAAENPSFVEDALISVANVSGRGYRFVAPLHYHPANGSSPVAATQRECQSAG